MKAFSLASRGATVQRLLSVDLTLDQGEERRAAGPVDQGGHGLAAIEGKRRFVDVRS